MFWFCWTTTWSCVGTMSRSCFSKWGVGRNFIHRPLALHYTLSLFHIIHTVYNIHQPKHIITLWWPEFYTQAPPAPYTQATRQAALGEGTLILSLFSVLMKIMMIVRIMMTTMISMITLMIRMMTLKIMMIWMRERLPYLSFLPVNTPLWWQTTTSESCLVSKVSSIAIVVCLNLYSRHRGTLWCTRALRRKETFPLPSAPIMSVR